MGTTFCCVNGFGRARLCTAIGWGAIEQLVQLQRQQERERELRERMAPNADTLQPAHRSELEIPKNSSCFALHTLELTGEKLEQVPWLKASAGIDLSVSSALAQKVLKSSLARMQQAVLEHGYVTSRVMVVPRTSKTVC